MTDNLAPQHPSMETPPQGVSIGAHVWGFFAGIASGVAFAQIFGGGVVGVLLAYVCLLPLYATGFAGGRGPVITAALFGIIAVFLQTMAGAGGLAAGLYALLFALPTAIICRVALMKTASGYTSGGVILLTTLIIGTLLLLIFAILGALFGTDITALTTSVAESYVAVMKETDPAINEAQLTQVKNVMASSLPGLMSLSWLVIHGLNYAIAQWFTSETGLAERQGFAVSELTLPNYLAPVAVASVVAGMFLDGNIGIVMGAVGMLLGVGFTLVGLAVLHALIINVTTIRGLSAILRNMLVVLFYLFCAITQVPLVFAFLLGLLDPWLNTRRKLIKTLV